MNKKTIKLLFAFVRSVISSTKLSDEERDSYSPDLLPDLLDIAIKHDVVHLLVYGLKQNDLISQEYAEIEKCIFSAVYRYERLKHEYENLCDALENARIPFIPLKGSVIRKYYPESWMRTSCDIDVLVHEEDLDKAVAMLVSDCGYTYSGKGSHNVSLFTSSKLHIELHFDLVEDGIAQESSEVLKDVWNTAKIREGYMFWHEMPDNMFYFYHIAHMAKHIENGGCGIRPFIDLWILDNIDGTDVEKRNILLSQGKLLKFTEVSRNLCRVWFEDAEYSATSEQLENYILYGGVYGNDENRIILQQQKKGGRLKYALSKIFIPYDVIKFHYPILKKYYWLTPIMEVRRWCKLIFCGHLKRTANELKYNSNVTDAEALKMKQFLKDIGL